MPKHKRINIYICSQYSVPGDRGGRECQEFLWSDGRECRLCKLVACHRRGMKAKDARADADEAWELRQEAIDA